MKLLHLTKHYYPHNGGIESVTFDIVEGIRQLGNIVDVICVGEQKKSTDEHFNGYNIYRVGRVMKLFSTSISPQLFFKFKKISSQYNLLHVHFPDPMAALVLFLIRPKTKLVIHWHGDIMRFGFILPVFRFLQNWVLKRADVIVGTSTKFIEESPELVKFKSKTVAIPIGIKPNGLVVNQETLVQLKTKARGRKTVFGLGRLVSYKGFEYLVKASQLLPDTICVFIGGAGPLFETLQNLINSLNLSDKVYLVGKIDEGHLGAYFEVADVFCFPSITKAEAFGVVQLEAMSFGKPIVATNIPGSGVSWVNAHGVTGYNVPVKDSSALASKLMQLLENETLYNEFSQNAKIRFNKLFTSDKMVGAFDRLYKDLLK